MLWKELITEQKGGIIYIKYILYNILGNAGDAKCYIEPIPAGT